jgi:hypothetical protein
MNRFRGAGKPAVRFTMSESSVLDSIVQAQAQAQEAQAEVAEEAQVEDEAQEDEAPPADERQLNTLLRKAEAAFTKGNKGLLLSRVECGKWCHAVYVLRQEQGHKDRSFTSQLIFNRLAVHADSKRECDANELAKMFQAIMLLSQGDAAWKGLTVGKLTDLLPLVSRVDGTELYSIFDIAKAEQAKALFTWACGDGINKPSREDIHNRVLELTDPAKYAVKVEKDAAKEAEKAAAKEAGAEASEDEDQEAPTNLIDTEARPAAPDWKDVPDGMTALFQEGCKQQPGKSADMMCDFAKQFVWTTAMIKGLLDGIANSKDGERAEQALQELVDAIAEEYSIFPASELAEAA